MELSQPDREAFLNRIKAVEMSRQEQQGEPVKDSSAKSEWTDGEIKMAISMGW